MIFNSFFISQSQFTLPEPIHPQYDLIDSFTITSQEVFDILNGLDISKSSGPDLVNPRLVKEGASCLSAPLSKFFNHILSIGKFSQLWKEANVTPLFKKGDRHIPNNYRPISLISCIGKVMERVIHTICLQLLFRS